MRPADRSYSASHEWVQLDGDLATVGITDFAIEQLGELVYLDLPEDGGAVSRGEAFGEVESVKAVSDLNSPIDGEIVEVNSALADELLREVSDVSLHAPDVGVEKGCQHDYAHGPFSYAFVPITMGPPLSHLPYFGPVPRPASPGRSRLGRWSGTGP